MKKLTTLLLSALLCFGLFACSGGSDSSAGNNSAENADTAKIEKNIDAVADHLGLKNGSETAYSTSGAKAGKEYNDGAVELYEFDADSAEYEAITKGEGSVKAAAYKDGIIILFTGDTDQDMVDKFKAIEFK